MKKSKFFLLIGILSFAILVSSKFGFFADFKNFLAATFFIKSIDIGDLKEKYKEAELGNEKRTKDNSWLLILSSDRFQIQHFLESGDTFHPTLKGHICSAGFQPACLPYLIICNTLVF